MARYLLESSATDGYLLEDGTGVLLLDEITGGTCLLVVADAAAPTATDAALKARIEAFGHTVTYISDETAADTSKDFVVIAESCSSTNVAAKYSTFAGNVLVMEGAVADDMDMAATSSNDATQTQIEITAAGASHALGDSLSAGDHTVFSASVTLNYNAVTGYAGSATIVATNATDANKAVIAAYETGATMLASHVAEGRRVMFMLAYDAGYANLNATGLSLLDAAITWVAPASSNPSVDPAALALALTAVAPTRIDQEVSPAALALALDTPAPSVPQVLDPAAIALSLGLVSPTSIDQDLSPAAVALTLATQAFTRVDQDASPAALALALATVAPDLLATVDPGALAIALTAQAPGRIDQDTSPAAIAVTLGTAALSVEARVDPATLDLVLTPVAPTRLDLAMDMPAIALTLSLEAPTRIDLDLTLTAQGLVLTPVAPARLDQDATLTAIAITLDTPAPVIDVAGSLTVSPGVITLLLAPEAPRVDQEASLAPIALAVGLATPALELGLGVGALSLTLTPEAPVSLDQQVLAQALAVALGMLLPSLEAIVEPSALAITLGAPAPTLTVVVTSSDGSIRMVSVPMTMGHASSMAGGSSVRLMPGAMTSREPTTQSD